MRMIINLAAILFGVLSIHASKLAGSFSWLETQPESVIRESSPEIPVGDPTRRWGIGSSIKARGGMPVGSDCVFL